MNPEEELIAELGEIASRLFGVEQAMASGGFADDLTKEITYAWDAVASVASDLELKLSSSA